MFRVILLVTSRLICPALAFQLAEHRRSQLIQNIPCVRVTGGHEGIEAPTTERIWLVCVPNVFKDAFQLL